MGDFVTILDADFVAFPNFLSRALTLFHDDNVGVLQTPQHFFNSDPMQHSFRSRNVLPDEQRYFFDLLLPVKDAWGVAFSCGTSSLTRSRALHSIVGIPVTSISGDMLLSRFTAMILQIFGSIVFYALTNTLYGAGGIGSVLFWRCGRRAPD